LNPDPVLPSSIGGIAWPPLPGGEAAYLGALMFQLEQTQWLPAATLAVRQHQQLVAIAAHAETHSPHFRSRMQAAGLRSEQLSTMDGLRRLPVMRRRDLQAAGEALFCTQFPRAHAPVAESSTSGSSGEPVVVKRTAISRLLWLAMTLREHLWQRRDFYGRLAIIRNDYLHGDQEDWPTWGPPASLLFETGSSHALAVRTGVARQFEWLQSVNPDYLLVYPSNLAALLGQFERHGLSLPRLRQIRTINETLNPEVRESARRILGADIADTYSSAEVGVIAVQCPDSGLYHLMAEGLIVELLNEQDEACMPGEIGRVVVTDLHNFATPLIRYDLGDYAEKADSCPCGRGLPVFKRVAGRRRNMARLPDGRSLWPAIGGLRYSEIAPIRQFQFIQRECDTIEVRLVSAAPLTAGQECRIGDLIREALDYPFKLQFSYFHEEIPRGRGGKFEEFICELVE
jgi:phenylacetate-coenzyme A ligase PaaK-like adenylate-forming protein